MKLRGTSQAKSMLGFDSGWLKRGSPSTLRASLRSSAISAAEVKLK